jgi:hypothetical protein
MDSQPESKEGHQAEHKAEPTELPVTATANPAKQITEEEALKLISEDSSTSDN